jgi:hypothetical protein
MEPEDHRLLFREKEKNIISLRPKLELRIRLRI